MSFRFRLGPFTFGRTGTRLSVWGRGSGFSVPLSGSGGSFGKVGFGPFRWFFRDKPAKRPKALPRRAEQRAVQRGLSRYEAAAIRAFQSDQKILHRIRQRGVPWRGVQERLKEELPNSIRDRDQVAYKLVPKAMDATFGRQAESWDTEKRPSKSGAGQTTWIVSSKPRT